MQNDAGAVVNCRFRSMSIPILIPWMQWRLENEKLTLEQLLKDLEGKLEEQGQTFQAQVILNFNHPWRKKLGHFPHIFLSPDIEESCFRWARRTARFDSFWKRSRKVGSCGGCIIMIKHHWRNVEMKPTLHSFVWVLGDAKFSGAGKQKYEQLVEIKLSLEMEIQTYRSILEDEEKRIRRSYLLFCLLLTSLGAVDMKMKTVRAMAFGLQDMKVDWTEFLTRTVMFCTLRWFLFF